MQYTPFISDIEIPFYSSLTDLKIDHDKLDDSARKLLGLYEIRTLDRPEHSCRMQIFGNALLNNEVPTGYYKAEGVIKNVNTIEEYRNMDRSALLLQTGQTIWDAIIDGTVYSCPSLLTSFVVLSFADLKRYRFYYWFAFPAIHPCSPWVPKQISMKGDIAVTGNLSNIDPQYSRRLTSQESVILVEAVQTWRHGVDTCQHGFFLAKKEWNSPDVYSTSSSSRHQAGVFSGSREPSFKWHVSSLSGYEAGFFEGSETDDRFVCFADPSNYDNAPGWMLRNLLVLAQIRWKVQRIQLIRYRDVHSKRDQGRSVVMVLETETASGINVTEMAMPKVTGWERNPSGQLAGRVVDLKEYMDPQRLADQSVDLNLKLMKWRVSPNLNLEKIKGTSCLLLGAGTLGSYVARNLLGWGVQKITFVDNGSVSFSNPVRQPLFNFKDCLEGGVEKAKRAADSLKEIYPGVNSTGYMLSVPMPGHPITDRRKAKEDFELLKTLIDNHDAIFLLMDTRESRWLPTVMGKAAGKIVLNAALGFDTFVAMRHGFKHTLGSESVLGCYFCNDVVAPVNSVNKQTLDQQCTVTRPGVAVMASAMLVELFVSILQHPSGAAAPAESPHEDCHDSHPLGIVPHQIRGFLSRFSTIVITGTSYKCCSACSDTIIDAYVRSSWEFVEQALTRDGYLEEVSGLKEVQQMAEDVADSLDFDDGLSIEDGELV